LWAAATRLRRLRQAALIDESGVALNGALRTSAAFADLERARRRDEHHYRR
jgi:hypothetical protein